VAKVQICHIKFKSAYFAAAMTDNKKGETSKWLVIFSLVLAGEMIFSLPFHVARFFRPTLLEVFSLSNTEFGDILSIYGFTAMLAYFPGGTFADRFSARKLMAVSLLATGLGGLYLVQIPGKTGMMLLFGYWGVTTIFLFWSAMIKATREWGAQLGQGKAFGILDGGRGLIAAGTATLAVFLLSSMLPANLENMTALHQKSALQGVIYLYTILTSGAAILVWFLIPETSEKNDPSILRSKTRVTQVLRNKAVWYQAIIIVCAYCGYKGLDYYSLYGTDVLGMNEIEAARFVSNASYLRAIAAISAGLIVDRLSASKVIRFTFLFLILCYFLLSILAPIDKITNLILANLIFTFAAVYALRGVYFALLEETKIAGSLTGTAVGMISLIGYTPDVFFNSIAGRVLDASPGLKGFQNFYLMLAFFTLIGMVATMMLVGRDKGKTT